jgi:hypothetical protein
VVLTVLVLKGVPPTLPPEALMAELERRGVRPTRVSYMRDASGSARGTVFANYASQADADRALADLPGVRLPTQPPPAPDDAPLGPPLAVERKQRHRHDNGA